MVDLFIEQVCCPAAATKVLLILKACETYLENMVFSRERVANEY